MNIRTAVALAWAMGRDIDLSACDYGPDFRGDYRAGPMRYYHFLAGLARLSGARRIVEVGTHFGGSARALAEGQRAAGLPPKVVTFDVEDRAGPPVLGFAGVERVHAELRSPDGASRLAAWAGPDPIDLAYVDALKDGEFVRTTVAALADRKPVWLVLDDIFANASIRAAWDQLRREHEGNAITVDEVALGIRSGGYGQGVIATGSALHALPTEPLRTLAGSRWRSVMADPDPADDQAARLWLLRHAVAGCRGEGEIVVVGANQADTVAVVEALESHPELGEVCVSVIAGFLGSGSAVRRDEPLLAEFRHRLGERAGRVNLVAGDVPSLRWSGRPIELVVACQSRDPSRLGFIWRELLPRCVPGGSLLLIDHSDRRGPVRPEQLGGLRAHLEVLGVRGGMVALAPVSTPDRQVLQRIVAPPADTSLSALGVPLAKAARRATAQAGPSTRSWRRRLRWPGSR